MEEVLIESYTITVVILILSLAAVPLIGALVAMALGIIRTYAPNAGNRPAFGALLRTLDRVSARLGISLGPVDKIPARETGTFENDPGRVERTMIAKARDIYRSWSLGNDSPSGSIADRRALERRQTQRRLETRRNNRGNVGRRDADRRRAERRNYAHHA